MKEEIKKQKRDQETKFERLRKQLMIEFGSQQLTKDSP